MLTKRIIPCLDVKNGKVVKGVNFSNIVDAGDPVEIIGHPRGKSLDGSERCVSCRGRQS